MEKQKEINQMYEKETEGGAAAGFLDPMIQIWNEWRQFLKEYKNLLWILGLFVLLVYGIRIIHDNIFIDSEIMVLRPAFMHNLWLGSSRFGLTFTSWLFGMERLIPYVQGILMAFTMYWAGIFLSYCIYSWSGHERSYRFFHYVFPMLFVSAPVFAEQFLFILQAFEIAFAILTCILAAYFVNRWVERKETVCLVLGAVFMVWTFGSYQAMFPLYIALAAAAFAISYSNGRTERAFRCGIKHVSAFLAGCLLYGIFVKATKYAAGTESAYISDMIRWNKDELWICLYNIRIELVKVLKGKSMFFHKIYFPSMCLFGLQMMYRGWKNKKNFLDYLCFLFSLGVIVLSPFLLNLITGSMQSIRTHLVYPVTSALFLAHLTVWKPGAVRMRPWRLTALVLAEMVCIFTVSRNGIGTAQIFQTAWEAYRNDVLTANRMYSDICAEADGMDMSECMVIFVGKRDAGLKGIGRMEELSGLSFFEAEAHTELGVSGRVGSLFIILGMDMKVMGAEDGEAYRRAIAYMEGAPNWPSGGSVKKMDENIIVVKLSDSLN